MLWRILGLHFMNKNGGAPTGLYCAPKYRTKDRS